MPIAVETYDSAAEAARALGSSPAARFMAGGTILMRAVNEADPSIQTLVRTSDPRLTEIRTTGNAIVLGAAVTMVQILKSREAAFLHPVARVIGGPQVRSAATVAGNLFAAAPYGDFAGALMALGASAVTADGRSQAVEDLMRQGTGRTLVTSITVPVPRDGLLFSKVSRVKPKGVSVMSVSAVIGRPGGRVEGARIVFNGMGERPQRAMGAERALNGGVLDAASIARAAAAVADGLSPQDDAIASAWYRREVAGVHLSRLLEGVQ